MGATLEIMGEERGLALSIRNVSRLMGLCPGRDLSRLAEVFEDGESIADLVEMMSDDYEHRVARLEGTAPRAPIDREAVLDLDIWELAQVAEAIMSAVNGSMATTVNARPKGKKEGATGR